MSEPEECGNCGQAHDGYQCCVCSDEDRPSWLEDHPICAASGGKVVHLTQDSARQHVAELRGGRLAGSVFLRLPVAAGV